jgi:hypothetical protein
MSPNDRHNPTAASLLTVPRSAWITLIVVSSVGLVPMYGATLLIPAIPDFIKELGTTYNTS